VKSLLRTIFVENWPRKAISLVLAVVIWLVVNHSLTATRIISNVTVRLVNMPSGKTVEGMQPGSTLAKRITLTLSGNKTLLDSITSNDLEVVVDAANAGNEMTVNIDKKNIISLNPELDVKTAVSRVSASSFVLRPMRLITEKIPIVVTSPIGEAPRGYQFLDVYPYRLFVTVSGPEKVVKRLKDREIRLTFNLNEISRSQLDTLSAKADQGSKDEICFLVPDAWKQISIPTLSDTPLTIDDPDGKFLRIDFVRRNLLPLDKPLPVAIFYPPEYLNSINPTTFNLASGGVIEDSHGVFLINRSLAVKGVSRLFLEVVKDSMEIMIVAEPTRELGSLSWSIQFINPRALEDSYIESLQTNPSEDDAEGVQADLREDYLRNRFRGYMIRMQLFTPEDLRFDIKASLQGNTVSVNEQTSQKSA
jgi:hypothetical protein